MELRRAITSRRLRTDVSTWTLPNKRSTISRVTQSHTRSQSLNMRIPDVPMVSAQDCKPVSKVRFERVESQTQTILVPGYQTVTPGCSTIGHSAAYSVSNVTRHVYITSVP